MNWFGFDIISARVGLYMAFVYGVFFGFFFGLARGLLLSVFERKEG